MVLWTIGREERTGGLGKRSKGRTGIFPLRSHKSKWWTCSWFSPRPLRRLLAFNLFGIRKEETKLKPLLLKSSKRLGYKTQRLLGGYNIDRATEDDASTARQNWVPKDHHTDWNSLLKKSHFHVLKTGQICTIAVYSRHQKRSKSNESFLVIFKTLCLTFSLQTTLVFHSS